MPITLRIEFSGLCLFVLSKDRHCVGVAMPDARRTPNIGTERHADNTPAVPHVGYLRFDLSDYSKDFPQAPANGTGPQFEAVHRFSHEELDLGLGDKQTKVCVDELLFPDFGEINTKLALRPGLFGKSPPTDLLMRTVLTGGKFTSHSGGSNWTFPSVTAPTGAPYQGQFANYVVWTGTVDNEPPLEVILRSLDKEEGSDGKKGGAAKEMKLKLYPNNNGVIQLRIANLCAENPLEWQELKIRTVGGEEDVDFKWLYRLMENPAVVLPAADSELPVPTLDRTGGVSGGEQDCTGGKTDGDI